MIEQAPVPIPPTAPPPAAPEPPEAPRGRHSLFFPLLLIAVGTILFLSNAGLMSGDMGQILLRLWPLIFVVGGLDSLYKREGTVGPLVFIALGVALILSNFGYLPGSSWESLLRLWPIFLVAIGLDLLFRGQSLWLTLARVGVGLLLAAAILWLAWTTPAARNVNTLKVDQKLDSAASAEVFVSQAVGQMVLSSGAPAGTLAVGSLESSGFTQAGTTYRVESGKGFFKAETGTSVNIGFNAPSDRWNLALSSEIPLSLTTRQAVGEQRLDLSGLKVSNLTSESAVGQIVLTLPAAGQKLNSRLSIAVGQIVIYLPKGARVRFNTSTGVGTSSFPPGFDQNPASPDVVLDLNVALGSVNVRYLP